MREHPTYRDARIAVRRLGERGMTLLEIIVVLVIVGLLLALGTMGVRSIYRTSLKANTVQVMAMTRAANQMALMTRQPHRMVIDFEDNSYRIERCEGDLKLRRTDREQGDDEEDDDNGLLTGIRIPPEMLAALSPEDSQKITSALTASTSKKIPCVVPTFPNGDTDGRGNKRKLEDGLSFKEVWVQHLIGKQNEGAVAITFFPLGYAEKAVIVLGDEDGNDYSLIVRGLTGHVELRPGEVDADRFMMRNAAGEDVGNR